MFNLNHMIISCIIKTPKFIKTTAEVLLTQKDGSEIIGFNDTLLR